MFFVIIKHSEHIVKIPVGIFERLTNFLCVNTEGVSM